MASKPTAQAPEGANCKASTSDAIKLPPIAREILENYSLIPSDEVAPHVARIVCHFPSPCFCICEARALLMAPSLGLENYIQQIRIPIADSDWPLLERPCLASVPLRYHKAAPFSQFLLRHASFIPRSPCSSPRLLSQIPRHGLLLWTIDPKVGIRRSPLCFIVRYRHRRRLHIARLRTLHGPKQIGVKVHQGGYIRHGFDVCGGGAHRHLARVGIFPSFHPPKAVACHAEDDIHPATRSWICRRRCKPGKRETRGA